MINEKLVEWAKNNAREGSNLAEFEEMVSQFKLPETPEGAWDFIQKNQPFKRLYDSELSKKNAEYDKRFQEIKLPEIEKQMRDRLAAELNPKETPEQKTIRELKERLDAKERDEKRATTRAALMKKASEKGFIPDLAAELADLDGADERLDKFMDAWDSAIKTKLDEMAKAKFGGSPTPAKGGQMPTSAEALAAKYNEALKSGNREAANLIYFQMQALSKGDVTNGQ